MKFIHFKIILLWIIFTATSPFIFYKLIPHHPYKLLVFAGLAIISIFFLYKKNIENYNPIIINILLVQIVYSILMAFLHQIYLGIDLKYFNLSFQFISVLILYLFITSYYSMYKVAISNILIIGGMSFFGAIAFFLVLGGYLQPFSVFKGPTWVTQNYILTTAASLWNAGGITVMRVAGFFDEPGTFAFYITFALITNKLYNYNTKMERIFIVCGLFTFSVAFFISLGLYLIIFFLSMKRLKYFVIFIFLGVMLLGYVKSMREESKLANTLYTISLGRLEIDSDNDTKIIKGDTRSEITLLAISAFWDAPFFGHGFSATELPRSKYYDKFFGANIFAPLAYHGIIGTLVLYGMYFYWTFLCLFPSRNAHSRIVIGSWVIISVNFLQRPDAFIGTYGYFVIIFLIYATLYKYQTNLDKKVVFQSQ